MNHFHDPSEYIRGIQQILTSDKKKIGFLFGAGTSLAKLSESSLTVPAVFQLTTEIIAELKADRTEGKNYTKVLDDLKAELGTDKFLVEQILSILEQKQRVIGSGTLNGMNSTALLGLISEFKSKIKNKVSVHQGLSPGVQQHMVQTEFAEWVGRVSRKHPIEIFTTNYDYLFEIGLEHHAIPYFTGFAGSFRPFFCSENVRDLSFLPSQTKLWKLHGSLGWFHDEETGRVIRRESDKDDILIYPSTLKYNDSQKQPYTSLLDRLCDFLKQDDSILFTCGYSFSDDHINEKILAALKTQTTSHLVGLVYDRRSDGSHWLTAESPLAKMARANGKIAIYGQRAAVIGCHYGKWRLRRESTREETLALNQYFDEDAPFKEIDLNYKEEPGNLGWSGEGVLKLGDFRWLVQFLKSMSVQTPLGVS